MRAPPEQIMAKNNYEQMALSHGVVVDAHHTDNDVYKSQAFAKAPQDNYQSIQFSGVGARWQNDAAEATIHWPDVDDQTLWPLALNLVACLHDHSLNSTCCTAPVEILSRTKGDCSALCLAHSWGFPVHILGLCLTASGGQIPKWQPRSRLGQHANNFGNKVPVSMLTPREPTPKSLTREYAAPIPLPEATPVPASAPAYIIASTINLSQTWDRNPAAASLLQDQIHKLDLHYQEYMHPASTQNQSPLKAKVSKDPDLPNLRESPTGPYAEEVWEAMDSEIGNLEDAFNFVHHSPIPFETKVAPGTWGQRIKQPHAEPYMTIWIISLDLHHCKAFIRTLKGSATIY
jgi:hypothetical protein